MAMASAESTNQLVVESAPGSKTALPMVITLFFLWGFITCLNDILIPHLKHLFTLNYAEVMLVQTFFFTGYFIFALPSGKVIDWIGYKWTMVAGLLVMAVGALCFLPAAMAPSFPLFLVALGIVAAGMTLLQVAANPYVIVLGPPETASSRLNLAQAFNSLGTTVAPYVGSLFILATVPLAASQLTLLSPAALHTYRVAEASVVKLPYTLIAVILVAFAFALALYKLPTIRTHQENGSTASLPSIWTHRHLVLAIIAIFVYVGAEVSIGSFLINYLNQPDIGNMPQKDRRPLRRVLLGRRNDWAFLRRRHHPEVARRSGAGRRGDHRLLPGDYIHVDLRPRRHVEHHSGRPLQLHHVAEYFCPRSCRARPAHQPRAPACW